MSRFIFTFPADTPPMTFEALAARLEARCNHHRNPRCVSCPDMIGTTVQVRWHTADRSAVTVRLYDTTIAVLTGDGTIRFPNDDPHMTTTRWIEKIAQDNGLGYTVYRVRRRKADGEGPPVVHGPYGLGHAGLLVINGDRDRPVHGRAWAIDREKMARDLDYAERWAAEMAFRCDHPDEWDADLAAARPGSGMPDYRDRVDPARWQGSRRRPSLSDIR